MDFFGRIRRATEAAQAEFFASEDNQKFVIQTLVTDLARAYFQLLALDQQLDISERTVKVREESLKLVQARFDYGWDSQTPVLMTENLLYGARAVVPELKRTIEQKENQISTLLGRNPGGIKRGKPLLKQDLTVSVPPGLPSSLLERRPDIRSAEESLVAANARIGEAKALLFPNIRMTGVAGWESAALKSLFTGPASFWDILSPGRHPAHLHRRAASGQCPGHRGPAAGSAPDLQKIHSASLSGGLRLPGVRAPVSGSPARG